MNKVAHGNKTKLLAFLLTKNSIYKKDHFRFVSKCNLGDVTLAMSPREISPRGDVFPGCQSECLRAEKELGDVSQGDVSLGDIARGDISQVALGNKTKWFSL